MYFFILFNCLILILPCRVSFLLSESKAILFYIHEQMLNVFLRTYISESIPKMVFSNTNRSENDKIQAV